MSYRLRGKVLLYDGQAAWHFFVLPKGPAREIRMMLGGGSGRGWGSVPVTATIGGTTWRTSIFPDRKAGSYLLPLKAQVRKAEGLVEGHMIEVLLDIEA